MDLVTSTESAGVSASTVTKLAEPLSNTTTTIIEETATTSATAASHGAGYTLWNFLSDIAIIIFFYVIPFIISLPLFTIPVVFIPKMTHYLWPGPARAPAEMSEHDKARAMDIQTLVFTLLAMGHLFMTVAMGTLEPTKSMPFYQCLLLSALGLSTLALCLALACCLISWLCEGTRWLRKKSSTHNDAEGGNYEPVTTSAEAHGIEMPEAKGSSV